MPAAIPLPTTLTRQFDLLERRLWLMDALVAITGAVGSLLLFWALQFASDRLWDTPSMAALCLCPLWMGRIHALRLALRQPLDLGTPLDSHPGCDRSKTLPAARRPLAGHCRTGRSQRPPVQLLGRAVSRRHCPSGWRGFLLRFPASRRAAPAPPASARLPCAGRPGCRCFHRRPAGRQECAAALALACRQRRAIHIRHHRRPARPPRRAQG